MMRTKKVSRPSAVSWSMDFCERVWRRRFILGQDSPHSHHNWMQALGPSLPVARPEIDSHAPWLNGECIAYLKAVGAPTVNGFYTR